VHRAEGSGTTSNFTGFLNKAAPAAWKLGKGDTVNWPTSSQAGNGNQGVAQLIGNGTGSLKGVNGAIGYVDFADAKATNLKTASVKNAAGEFVAPSLTGVSAALEETTPNADLTFDPLNAAGNDAYPIATPTWILTYKNQTDKAKGEALKGYLNFLLTDGQALNEPANFAQLPASYRTKAIAQLETMVIPS
nr:substrate-binding domain-containing protein [Actinomycetota bacterium]